MFIDFCSVSALQDVESIASQYTKNPCNRPETNHTEKIQDQVELVALVEEQVVEECQVTQLVNDKQA